MNKKIMILICSLMAMVWAAGCSCPGIRPVVAAPPVVEPPPYVPQPEVVKPQPPVEEPVPSKKLKKRVIRERY